MKEAASYLESFEGFERKARQPAWLRPLRQAGISSFRTQGFPTVRDEDWRFTNADHRRVAKKGLHPRRSGFFAIGSVSPKRNSFVDVALLEHAVREDLNARCKRAMGVGRPLRVVLENLPDGREGSGSMRPGIPRILLRGRAR